MTVETRPERQPQAEGEQTYRSPAELFVSYVEAMEAREQDPAAFGLCLSPEQVKETGENRIAELGDALELMTRCKLTIARHSRDTGLGLDYKAANQELNDLQEVMQQHGVEPRHYELMSLPIQWP